MGRVTVTLVRPMSSGLGMGFNDSNCVSALGPGTPSAECGQIFLGDQLMEINGIVVAPGGVGAMVRATAPGSAIDFTFMRETGQFEPASGAAPKEAPSGENLDVDELPPKGEHERPEVRPMQEDELAMLLEPSGDLLFDKHEREATADELRGNALTLMTELVRQGFCAAAGKRALLEVLPTLLSALMVLFESQTRSKLDREEHKVVRNLMCALLEGVLQARRAETGAAVAPFSELREQLPHAFLKLLQGLKTKGLKVRWPRLFADSSALHTTPDVKAAFEVTNFLPLTDAVQGLLECVEEWGAMPLASSWAHIAQDWLRSNDVLVRFKALCILRLLIPRLEDSDLSNHMVYALVRAMYQGLAELQGVYEAALDASDPATKEALLQEKERELRAAMTGEAGASDAPPIAKAGQSAGRKPPTLALAEEALCTLHEIARRRLAAGDLLSCPALIWLPFALAGCPYKDMLCEVYPMLCTVLSARPISSLLGKSRLPTPEVVPNFDGGYKPDAFSSSLLPMLLRGLHCVGWWGVIPKVGGGPRPHHMDLASGTHVLTSLRLCGAIRAAQLLPDLVRGEAPAGAEQLLELFVLQISAMYDMAGGAPTSRGQRLVFEPLLNAARAVDVMAGEPVGGATMSAMLEGFLQGEFNGRAFDLLRGLATPLYSVFLPKQSQLLARLLTRVLGAGPEPFHDAVLLLVATACRQPSAPDYVTDFGHFFQLAIGEESFAATECLTAAMQASQLAGEDVSPQVMALGEAFDQAEAKIPPADAAAEEAARSGLAPLEQVLNTFKD